MQAFKIAKEHKATQKGALPQATGWLVPHFTDFVSQLSDIWFQQSHLKGQNCTVLGQSASGTLKC